jgi:3-dehydroquinate synthase
VRIRSGIRDYDVHFVGAAELVSKFQAYRRLVYVIDENVWDIYRHTLLKGLSALDPIVMPISEERKSLGSVQDLYDRLTVHPAKRNLTLCSIGGGVLQDITGFVASTLYRGINWLFVPTTLLAQADSCIGSKTSLNYKGFKNLIGTFYPPSAVLVYAGFLTTQKDADFFSGVGEVIKLHLIGGAEKCDQMVGLLPKVVTKDSEALFTAVKNSLEIKREYIIGDEFDTGKRNLLNYGHCFGHALESASNFEISHGQAVIIGILLANIVARNRGLLSKTLEAYVAERLLVPSLTVRLRSEHLEVTAIIEAMKRDKKRTGQALALIMMKNGYEMAKVNDLAPSEVTRAVDELNDFVKVR